jgi:hypothetical protein
LYGEGRIAKLQHLTERYHKILAFSKRSFRYWDYAQHKLPPESTDEKGFRFLKAFASVDTGFRRCDERI